MAGRPSMYSEELVATVLARMTEGESLLKISQEDGMPTRTTWYRWLDEKPDLMTKCAHARDMQADFMDEKILQVADECTESNAHSSKVKLSAYQWRASKLAPKKYGDRLQADVTHGVSDPLAQLMREIRGSAQKNIE